MKLSGFARYGETDIFEHIILYKKIPAEDGSFALKELLYKIDETVELLRGFQDLEIIEIENSTQEVNIMLNNVAQHNDIKGFIFTTEGILMITDLDFFSGYMTNKDTGEKVAYLTQVDQESYEGEEAESFLEDDARLY